MGRQDSNHKLFIYKYINININISLKMVPEAGIEPARGKPQRILSPLRLPIPPLGQK
jgi:hypothetical protein